MTTKLLGTTFPDSTQWHHDEKNLINSVIEQINVKWPDQQNLLINTTWFGPQFAFSDYNKIFRNQADNLFFLSAVDPVMINDEQMTYIAQVVGAKSVYKLGNFDSDHQFTFIATLLPKFFKTYDDQDIKLKSTKWLYACYNRKPRIHRIEMVNKLIENQIDSLGVITLGQDVDNIYGQDVKALRLFDIGESPDDYADEGNWHIGEDTHGIPQNLHSLGNLDIWQNHFLNIVGETEFNPWDNMFITEKTWKPIIGLRPFVINGQTKIYSYLRDNGFKTFNHYWPTIDIEHGNVPETIAQLIIFLQSLGQDELMKMYEAMWPDLKHNQQRFFTFAQEQNYKLNHIFE